MSESNHYKHTYTEIANRRNQIRKKFPSLAQQVYREWPGSDKLIGYDALIFGSGNIKEENNEVLKKSCKSITTIDSDHESGADFFSLSEVDSNSFDIVIADHIIEHIPIYDCSDIFSSFREKLREKGEIVITVPNIANFGSWFSHYDHKNFSPWYDICSFIELGGFNVDHVFYWSRRNKTTRIQNFTDFDEKIASFLYLYYGLSIADFITIHAIKE